MLSFRDDGKFPALYQLRQRLTYWQRSVYCDHNDEATENSADDSDKYWVSVDNTLVEIRNMSNGNKALENK